MVIKHCHPEKDMVPGTIISSWNEKSQDLIPSRTNDELAIEQNIVVQTSEMESEAPTQLKSVRPRIFSLEWWLPGLIRGALSGLFVYLGIGWLNNTDIWWVQNEEANSVVSIFIFVLSIVSAAAAERVASKLIGVKEIY